MFFCLPRDVRRVDVQLTLSPPPRHCPHGTNVEQFSSAALGRLACTRTVREPGAICDRKHPGCLCAGLLCIEEPTSSMRMCKSGSATARRPATMQPAAPPMERTLSEKGRVLGRGEEDGASPAMIISYSSLIWVGVDIISWRPDGMGKRPLG